MKAVTVEPGVEGSVDYEDVPDPDETTGSVLVEAVAVGICGTDVESPRARTAGHRQGGSGSSSVTSRWAGSSIPGPAAACRPET
jgi:NADPH:quinone reductase-like Zn-dependent oxidoreductase